MYWELKFILRLLLSARCDLWVDLPSPVVEAEYSITRMLLQDRLAAHIIRLRSVAYSFSLFPIGLQLTTQN